MIKIENLHCCNYKLYQNKKMFCFGIDAVLLADFAKVKKKEYVVDLCTGNGIIPMLLNCKSNSKKIVGVDIIEENINMCRKSAKVNGISEEVIFYNEDILKITNRLGKHGVDVVTVNPPYMIDGSGKKNVTDEKKIARHEIMCTLEDVIRVSSDLLKYGGRFYMVHRPNRLGEIFYMMKKYKIEPKVMKLVQPYEGKVANIVLIEGLKNGKEGLIIENNLVVYNNNREYTEEVKKIYEDKK